MTLRKPHGRTKELGSRGRRVEVHPIDELPAGIPVEARPDNPSDRGESGRFAPGNGLARIGGHAKQGQTQLANRLGLMKLEEGSDFAPYRAAAVSFRRAQCQEIARVRGGGVCGAGPSSFVATAAIQLAWSRYFSDLAAARGGDAQLATVASRMGDASRQNIIAANDLAGEDAEARAKARSSDKLPSWFKQEGAVDGA